MPRAEPSQPDAARRVELRTGTPYANLIAAQGRFAETLGAHWGVRADSVIPTPGATGAIEAVRNHVLRRSPRKRPVVLTVAPGYWRARESFEGIGFEVVSLRTEGDSFAIDEAALAGKAREIGADLVYLSLPNNPTGATFDPRALVAGLAEETGVCLDLTLPSRGLDSRALTGALYRSFEGRDNLFLVGSTSKSHGTAEHRIGWAVCASAKDARDLRAENRSGVSTSAIAEGISRLAEPPSVLENIERSFALLEEGERGGSYALVKPARRVKTSYVLVKWLTPAERAKRVLAAAGIQVMWGSDVGLTDGYVRVETIEHTGVRIFVREINDSPEP